MLQKVKDTALKAARAAGAIQKERCGKIQSLDYKSAFNIVTDVDAASEKEVIRLIRESFPDHEILGEESGAHSTGSKCRWLIDPLDGTTNFAHSYPFFCVSIGYEEDGEMRLGVVFNPIADELFVAEKGKGATLNGQPIKVSAVSSLSTCLLATGFPPDSANARFTNITEFSRLTDLCHGVRRDGSAALDLCFVACGRLDGFWEFKLAPWDLAAGTLIVREAGGTVVSLTGGKFDMDSGHVLACNGLVTQEIVSALALEEPVGTGI
ncbi:MAG: inositol monophosphatase [Candidatus Obscuribacterales bacterium]|nr:inositol monophosphatase [Candidatus Obscuribacterales bacterium]